MNFFFFFFFLGGGGGGGGGGGIELKMKDFFLNAFSKEKHLFVMPHFR